MDYDDGEWADRSDRYEDATGHSALHRVTRDNPRSMPCPTCGTADALTAADARSGYQCDDCAAMAEAGYDGF